MLKVSCVLQGFGLIFEEIGRKQRGIHIGSAATTRLTEEQWISVRFLYMGI